MPRLTMGCASMNHWAEGIFCIDNSARGYGESKPVASNDTKEDRAENRRMEADLKGVYKKK